MFYRSTILSKIGEIAILYCHFLLNREEGAAGAIQRVSLWSAEMKVDGHV